MKSPLGLVEMTVSPSRRSGDRFPYSARLIFPGADDDAVRLGVGFGAEAPRRRAGKACGVVHAERSIEAFPAQSGAADAQLQAAMPVDSGDRAVERFAVQLK